MSECLFCLSLLLLLPEPCLLLPHRKLISVLSISPLQRQGQRSDSFMGGRLAEE